MNIAEVSEKARVIRELVIKMLVEAGSGHSAGALGMADVFATLYFGEVLALKSQDPWWEERDRIVLSAGHLVPVWYATLAKAGYFPEAELETLRCLNSRLQGHPHRLADNSTLHGIENTAGPLGQGMSVAVGMALALQQKPGLSRNPRVICICSDGELEEGQAWEALMCAGKYKLEQLTFIIDRNHIQIDGLTEEVMPLEPLKHKLEAFGLCVIEVDGHNIQSIIDGLALDAAIHGKPTAIIAHTIPGKGVSFMENLVEWHGKPPMGTGEAVEALDELRSLGGKITYD